MTKRIAILAALVAVAVALAGCGFKHPVEWIEIEEKQRIVEALERWVDGIEDYDVDAMAGSGILAAGFKLVMKEGQTGEPYEKNVAKLMEELLADKANQERFREEKNYELEFDVDWGPITIAKQSSATVIGDFRVLEKADGLDDWWNSDNGTIEITLVRTPNAWKMISMKIVFDIGTGATSVGLSDTVGLGLGRLPSMLGW
jgi:hypothetical protein